MKANCQIELNTDVKTALGRICRAGIWHNAERVSRGYDLIEFGDFIGDMLVKRVRDLEHTEETQEDTV